MEKKRFPPSSKKWSGFKRTGLPISTIRKIISALRSTACDGLLFNHYKQVTPEHDQKNGADLRCKHLAAYLRWKHAQKPALLLIGEAAGYQGSRFSGMAFTSEWTLMNDPQIMHLGLGRTATRARLWREPSGTMVWGMQETISQSVVLWNTIPFHPYKAGKPLSNRTPTPSERKAHAHFLDHILALFPRAAVVAVGNQAHAALDELGVGHTKVRHPSHGGKTEFIAGIQKLTRRLGPGTGHG